MSNEDLQQLKALASTATLGPWKVEMASTCSAAWPRIVCDVQCEEGEEAVDIAELSSSHVETDEARNSDEFVGDFSEKPHRFALNFDGQQVLNNAAYLAAVDPQTILTLIAKVESLAADAERLDFVIEKGAFVTWSLRDSTIKQCQLMSQDEDEDFHYLSGNDKYFNTVRAAIDAAMAKEKA